MEEGLSLSHDIAKSDPSRIRVNHLFRTDFPNRGGGSRWLGLFTHLVSTVLYYPQR
jgi:hypothetical protein